MKDRICKILFCCFLIAIIAPTQRLKAQKKEIAQARTYIKSGKDYDKAEQLMTKLLKDSANRLNKQILYLRYVAIKMQYEQGNEKLYLKEKYDTATFYQLSKRLLEAGEMLDSVDALPNKKGKVNISYRQRHSEELNLHRPNLFYGGTYYVIKKDYAQAYEFFQAYLECARQPLFQQYDYAKNDSLMTQAAYWATYAGYCMDDADKTIRYRDDALRDSAKYAYTLRYLAEAYSWQKDDEKYREMLETGFKHFPTNPYFFPRLVDFYQQHQLTEEALRVSDEAIAVDPKNIIFLFAKSTILLNQERYDECIAVSNKLSAVSPQQPEPYFNIATAKLNQVLELDKRDNPRQYRSQIHQLYMEALPRMEKYRQLAPDEKRKWAPALYRIYLNLNMGKQFEEIDKVMKTL
jgi:predicted Zn-dependent protease